MMIELLAKAQGKQQLAKEAPRIEVPPSLLARADEMIE